MVGDADIEYEKVLVMGAHPGFGLMRQVGGGRSPDSLEVSSPTATYCDACRAASGVESNGAAPTFYCHVKLLQQQEW